MVRTTNKRFKHTKAAQWWLLQPVTLRLITVNVAVFLLLHILAAANIFRGDSYVEQTALKMVELPAALGDLLSRPWTIVTYMFAQYDLLHLIFNMLWLYWFGMFMADAASAKRILGLYVAGGFAGALFYIVAANTFPAIGNGGVLIGSSAAVLAIVTATALQIPDREISFLFIGAVKIKWIALIIIAFDLIGIGGENGGGHLAHLGGTLAGVIHYCAWRFVQSRRRSVAVVTERDAYAAAVSGESVGFNEPDDVAIDRILDKIRRSGYSSLSESERHHLLSISGRLRDKAETKQ